MQTVFRTVVGRLAVFILLTATAIGGCTQSEMRYHFAAVDLDAEKPMLEFYRVTIKGDAGNSKADLQTGYYDAKALHQLFGEVSSKAAGDKVKTNTSSGTQVGTIVLQIDPASGEYRVVNQDERFTVVWGANADALAQQIGAFADAETSGEAIGGLIAQVAGRDEFELLYSTRAHAENRQRAIEALATELDRIAEQIGKVDTSAADTDGNGTVDAAEEAAATTALQAAVQIKLREAMQQALIQAGSGAVLPDDYADSVTETKGAVDAIARQEAAK